MSLIFIHVLKMFLILVHIHILLYIHFSCLFLYVLVEFHYWAGSAAGWGRQDDAGVVKVYRLLLKCKTFGSYYIWMKSDGHRFNFFFCIRFMRPSQVLKLKENFLYLRKKLSCSLFHLSGPWIPLMIFIDWTRAIQKLWLF